MICVGIETSCDETAVAVIKDGNVLSNRVSSSVHLHASYGGVIPEIASRYHTEFIYSVFAGALGEANITPDDIELVAVTNRPGLPGSLLVGMAFAKAISFSLDVPLVGVDHVHAHIVSAFLGEDMVLEKNIAEPYLGLVVSGGHTSIYLCEGYDKFELIGRTKDDAVGEAFDKVSKIMGLGYPGGPVIEKISSEYFQDGGKDVIGFPKALINDRDSLDFSFSGIKTSVLYYWQSCEKKEIDIKNICYAFQEAVTDTIVEKIKRAVKRSHTGILAVGGGVINNTVLRNKIEEISRELGIKVFLPEKQFCMDNGAMVGLLAEVLYEKGYKSDLTLKALA